MSPLKRSSISFEGPPGGMSVASALGLDFEASVTALNSAREPLNGESGPRSPSVITLGSQS